MNPKKCLQSYPQGTFPSLALLLIRLIVGLAFIQYGWGKIQNPFGWMGPGSPYPSFLLFLAALSEFGGGIALVLGVLTPLASFGIFCTMVVATYYHAIVAGDPFVNTSGGASYAIAVVYLGITVVLMAMGPGKFSLDRLIFGERKGK
jgi:putative oxidoreductase